MPSVKQLFAYVVDYVREDFHPGYYATVALFLCAAFSFNFAVDFKLDVLNPTVRSPLGIFWFALFYGCAYYAAALAWVYFHREPELLRTPAFWGLGGLAVMALALDNYSTNLPRLFVATLDVPPPVGEWLRKCLFNLDRMVAITLPVFLFRRYVDRQPGAFYGIDWRGFDWRPYGVMLLVMVPLVGWASFRPDFLATYPTYRPAGAEAALGVSGAFTFGIYETTYALRYVAIEIFFRGLLVQGFAKYLGRAALMPMVTLYAFWHFGKPLPEALGSVVAAYVLGIFALRSGSIIGGIIVHVGVALAMEFAAYLQLFGFAGRAGAG
jgi:hypothetical protein